MLAFREGSFFFDTEADPGEETLDLPTGSLLMEGMRRVDEVLRLRDALPATSRATFIGGESDDALEKSILGYLGPGARDVGDIVAGMLLEGLADEYDALRALQRLVERGVVRVAAREADSGQPPPPPCRVRPRRPSTRRTSAGPIALGDRRPQGQGRPRRPLGIGPGGLKVNLKVDSGSGSLCPLRPTGREPRWTTSSTSSRSQTASSRR